MKEAVYDITNLAELQAAAEEIFKTLVPTEKAVVLALSGDLGSGKTTFVQILGQLLNVTETITSPTFTILKRYDCNDSDWEQLLHMDAYRLEDTSELKPLQFNDLISEPKTLFCIEWAEKIEAVLNENYYHLNFDLDSNGSRTLTFSFR